LVREDANQGKVVRCEINRYLDQLKTNSMNKAVDFKIVEEPKKPMAMHPKKFGMWLFMASVMMLFMSLTSAYIVRRAEGNWVLYELPTIFTFSTVVVVISSVTMQLGFYFAKRERVALSKNLVVITLLLGLAFLATQYMGLLQLVQEGHYFTGGNVSESFFYVFPWLHGLHIVSALIYLLIAIRGLIKRPAVDMVQLEMCTTYWHFLGVLWVYLFVFLTLLR
jgi:cytochrome c oxidase subunit III